MMRKHVITIGDFDGVHRGHREILRTLQEWADSLGAEPMVLSFDGNSKGRPRITNGRVRAYYFRQCGIEHWQILDFQHWRDVSAEDFTDHFLKEELNTVGVVCGEDFRFGRNRSGNEFTLIGRGIAVKKVNTETVDDLRISSSAIRKFLEAGDLEQAERRLGHPFCLMGEIAHGKGLAHQYGLPTVNIPLEETQLLPPFGVYAAWAVLNGVRYPAAANIGVRPTVESNGMPNLEAHILAELPEIYGKELRIELKSYLRREMKFADEEQLFLQIRKDGEMSKERLELLG